MNIDIPQPTYTVPDDPPDPETAALELLVRMPELVGKGSPSVRAVLQEFAGLLQAENAFTGLSWHDAKHAAVAIVADSINCDDPARTLRRRARGALWRIDGMQWDDRHGTARALDIAADMLDK